MTDTPTPPKNLSPPKPSQAKLARQARLDAALRANLRRRKAPEQISEQTSEQISEPASEKAPESNGLAEDRLPDAAHKANNAKL